MDNLKKIGHYSVYGSLSSQGSTKVLAVRNTNTFQNFALKLSDSKKALQKEYDIIKALSKNEDFMKVYEYGKTDQFDYIVMEIFGRNLQYQNNDYFLSIRTVAAVGLEVIKLLEFMHSQNIVHGKIKPSSFLLSNDQKKVLLVDFGSSTYYHKHKSHETHKNQSTLVRNMLFASINLHLGFRPSRRDDIESLCYSLIYLIRGNLPWSMDKSLDLKQNLKLLLNFKINVKPENLFKGVPIEIQQIFKYSRKLLYEQVPNYNFIRNLLSRLVQEGPIFNNFDWIINPDFFNNVSSKVDLTKKNPILYLKNCNGQFACKRRNGGINDASLKKFSRSFDVKEIEQLRKSWQCEDKIANLNVFENKKNRFLSVEDCFNSSILTGIHNTDICEAKSSSFTIPESSSSNIELSGDDGEETSRSALPEFEDKKKAIGIRNSFIQGVDKKCDEDKCSIV